MCGIVGAIARESVTPILLEGLKRLEYRGYDSAGIAVLNNENMIQRTRTRGKVAELEHMLSTMQLSGRIGIAHTRWATHGEPSEDNAHPHVSSEQIALVHNGIIENYESLHDKLSAIGYQFNSETDSELIAHLIHYYINQGNDFHAATRLAIAELSGAFALGIMDRNNPEHLIAVRCGSPLVIGLGDGGHYLASDHLALLNVANRFIFLEEGDIAEINLDNIVITDMAGQHIERTIHEVSNQQDARDKGNFRHYMLKEIYEQPEAIIATMASRIGRFRDLDYLFDQISTTDLARVKHIHIIACGTSYHAGLVAKYWLEAIAGIHCMVEVASEYRYRYVIVPEDTLFLTISQSGETADTLAALNKANQLNYLARVGICNVESSTLVRAAEQILLTRAGTEIGVASTKAFTTQLVVLYIMTMALAKARGQDEAKLRQYLQDLQSLPKLSHQAIALNQTIEKLAERFVNKQHALFLGRGIHHPIACEGALKLKEISYIHAEAYPAGELKHGPLALVDKDMPVIAVAPNDELIEKLKNNLHEVRARGGELYLFADRELKLPENDGITIIPMPSCPISIAPIVYTIPLQLLAYHVAVLKGTDVDQPRNLAKSVTVE